ncbi:MAG TPA: hypothetical protein VHQ86_04080, partial [Candidatus Saccharimonadia bacterium]|nr:hypothetical protein [Candidatus Saccharimonadia bacterium]
MNKPGFVPNEGGTWSGGKGTNAYWRQILAEYMASEWAHGNRDKVLEIISPTWLSAKYGEPDPSDIAAGDNKWSERTLLAFSKWAADYQPGWSPYIDQVLPYVPPGPDEFIETPEQTADRVLNETQDKDRAESARQFDITTGQSALDAWIQAELDKYATQGSIYGDQEQNRSENLRHAGDLSSTLQAAMDARTKSALDQKADPGDYLRAEYESRAIAPP